MLTFCNVLEENQEYGLENKRIHISVRASERRRLRRVRLRRQPQWSDVRSRRSRKGRKSEVLIICLEKSDVRLFVFVCWCVETRTVVAHTLALCVLRGAIGSVGAFWHTMGILAVRRHSDHSEHSDSVDSDTQCGHT